MDNSRDYYLNNVVFIKQETYPSQKKQKIEVWWLGSIRLGMGVAYSMLIGGSSCGRGS